MVDVNYVFMQVFFYATIKRKVIVGCSFRISGSGGFFVLGYRSNVGRFVFVIMSVFLSVS